MLRLVLLNLLELLKLCVSCDCRRCSGSGWYKSLRIQRMERPDDDPEIKRVETRCPITTDNKEHQETAVFCLKQNQIP